MYNPFSLLLAIIRILIIVFSLIIFLAPYLLYVKLFGTTEQKAFKLRRTWVKFIKIILGISIDLEGTIPRETCLYVSNHRSFADPLILACVVDSYVIAKAEVSNIPLIGKGAELTGVIYVERGSTDSRSAVRKKMVETLLSGKNVMVYPEGTTNANLEIKPYKKGTFHECAQNHILVVPIVLEYKKQKDLWQNTGMVFHHFKQFGRLTTKVKIVIGPLMKSEDGDTLRIEVENWTNLTIRKIHSNWDSYFNKLIKQV